MNNPFNLKRGETAILDKDCNNSSEVIIVDFTPKELYTTVRNYGEIVTWDVMTNRLSPLIK